MQMDKEVNKLAAEIAQKALAAFAEKAGAAFQELEETVGPLPEPLVKQWNRAIQQIVASVFSV